MPEIIQVNSGDEVSDVIERVRGSAESAVALVFGSGTEATLTPVALRLLSQFSRSANKQTSIVTGDPRGQSLARSEGFPVYASTQAYDRGIELRASPTDRPTDANAPNATPAVVPVAPPLVAVAAPATAAVSHPRPLATARQAPPGRERRRPFYYIAIALAVVGLLLFLFVAPSAKVTITVAATPLTANPTLQGSTDPAAAALGDHILTGVVNSDASQPFQTTPTGQKALPGVPATAQLQISTDIPGGAILTIPKGEEFDTSAAPPLKFYATQDTPICVGANGSPPAQCSQEHPTANAVFPVQEGTGEAKGNVSAGAINVWLDNPCTPHVGLPTPTCAPKDLVVSNPRAATGGADPHTITVVSPTDLSGWTDQVTALKARLTARINQDLDTRANGRQFAIDAGGSGKTLTFDVQPALPHTDDPYAPTQITVSGHAKAAVYSMTDVRKVVLADLATQIPQGNTLAADKLHLPIPTVTQASDDGTVILAAAADGFAEPTVDLSSLTSRITGKSPDDARHTIEHAIGPQVSAVDVSQKPIGLFFLPFFSSRIELDETFVAQPSHQ